MTNDKTKKTRALILSNPDNYETFTALDDEDTFSAEGIVIFANGNIEEDDDGLSIKANGLQDGTQEIVHMIRNGSDGLILNINPMNVLKAASLLEYCLKNVNEEKQKEIAEVLERFHC